MKHLMRTEQRSWPLRRDVLRAGLIVGGLAALPAVSAGQVDPNALRFTIQPIGLMGPEYSHPVQGNPTVAYLATDSGVLVGRSTCYEAGTGRIVRYDDWVTGPGGVGARRIGLTGPEYRHTNGWESSRITKITDSGLILGY